LFISRLKRPEACINIMFCSLGLSNSVEREGEEARKLTIRTNIGAVCITVEGWFPVNAQVATWRATKHFVCWCRLSRRVWRNCEPFLYVSRRIMRWLVTHSYRN